MITVHKNRPLLVKSGCAAAALLWMTAAPAFAMTVDHDLEKWTSTVNHNLNQAIHEDINDQANDGVQVSVLGLTIDKEGHPHDIHMVHPTGNMILDQEALRVAKDVYYPPLPNSLHSKAQNIQVKLLFDSNLQELADVNRQVTRQLREQNKDVAIELAQEQLAFNENKPEV
ncbi:MAG: TonB family protein [Zymomonas mobilis]|uniref:TonB family protein n=1 Tax=Zymomonas mobilis TaxID=542 RepID=A0A542W1I6_ZYMMB|nr:TonB family protein [Zymomonas mobilis]TQL17451.1 TonB family protein [Zymomonas mobilis]